MFSAIRTRLASICLETFKTGTVRSNLVDSMMTSLLRRNGKKFVLFKIRELKYFKIYSCFNPQECLMQNHIEIKTTLLDGRCLNGKLPHRFTKVLFPIPDTFYDESDGLKLRMPPCLPIFCQCHLEYLRKIHFWGSLRMPMNASITKNSNLRAGLFLGHYGAAF